VKAGAEKQWKAVIVDDERLARQKLRAMLAVHPEIHIIGEADSVATAASQIAEARPDLVFLDIQMPGESGFDLLTRLPRSLKIIFVTAFDEYALRAFEVNALDYLLKPVNPERLANAVARLSSVETPPEDVGRLLEYDDFLFLPFGDGSRFLKVSEIKCVCAAGSYSEVITDDDQKALVLKPLGEWEFRLPARHFARIHRATLINVAFVERTEKWFNYSYQVYLNGIKEPFTMSRRYAAKLKEKLF
jgi:two-component system LytT family response regulator